MVCTSYFLMEDELGDGRDIDRFVMPQGTFTPRISVVRCADFSDFRTDFSMAISPQVTVIHSTWPFSTKLTPIRKIPTSANPLHAREHYCKKLSPNMSKWLQKRRSSENLVYGRTSSYAVMVWFTACCIEQNVISPRKHTGTRTLTLWCVSLSSVATSVTPMDYTPNCSEAPSWCFRYTCTLRINTSTTEVRTLANLHHQSHERTLVASPFRRWW